MTEEAQPINQPIAVAIIAKDSTGVEGYTVGNDEVTKIEIVHHQGPASWVPYVRVWQGDKAVGEWAQHAIIGLQFAKDDEEITKLIETDTTAIMARIHARALAEGLATDVG